MKKIYEPVKMNHIEMKNRLIRSATWEGIANPDGSVTSEAYEIYEELAKGGIGAIITGFTSVAFHDYYFGGMMRLCDDVLIPQYKELTDIIHAEGIPVITQLALGAYYREIRGRYMQVALLAEWDYSSNSTVNPHEISRGCNKKVWWVCTQGHHYEATVNSRAITGTGCPYCSGHRVWHGFNDIATTHPDVAKEWIIERNGELTPQMVSSGSNKKVWWHCRVCGFEWEAKIQSRCHGSKCPNCKGE